MRRLWLGSLLLAVLSGWALVAPPPASAIPAFARRYGVSCSTCHDAWPHLNATGMSFMMSGYRRLNGMAVQPTTKDIEVALGALSIPSIPPLAIVGTFGFDFQQLKRRAADGSKNSRTGSSFDVDEIEILAGAPLGKHLSFFLDYDLTETEIEHPAGPGEANETGTHRDLTFETEGPSVPGMLMMIWNSLLPESVAPVDSLNVIAGINELPLEFSPEHRRLSATPYLIYERRALDLLSGQPLDDLLTENENNRLFRLSKPQTGVELNGMILLGAGGGGMDMQRIPMIEYHVGVANGSNNRSDPNTEKDVFGRLTVRWWGQTLGSFAYYSPDIYSDRNRQDHAINAGGIFSGRGRHNRASSVGPDLTLSLAPWNVALWIENQVLFNHESDPTGFKKSFDWWGGFSQLNWKVVSPLVAYARYDWLHGDRFEDTDNGGVTGPVRPREWQTVFGLQWYVLDNFKLIGEYSHREYKNDASSPTHQRVKDDFFSLRASIGF